MESLILGTAVHSKFMICTHITKSLSIRGDARGLCVQTGLSGFGESRRTLLLQ